MMTKSAPRLLAGAVFAATLAAAAPTHAELTKEELAKMAQNPVGNLITVPLQSNTHFNVGPLKGTQEVLNIQPVIPIEVNSEWSVITRSTIPVIWNPALSPTIDSKSGVGDIVFSAHLSPCKPGAWIWSAGPFFQLPTNSNAELGNKNWGMGPEFVFLHLDHESQATH